MINEEPDPAIDGSAATDMPGRSNVRSWPSSDSAGPEVHSEAASLMYRLAIVALALATSQLEIRSNGDRVAICTSCGETTSDGCVWNHRPGCLGAEVIRIVDELKRSGILTSNLDRREDGSRSGEDRRAADGNRPRSAFREPWQCHCGPEPGMFQIVDRDGCSLAVVSGRFLNRLAIAERIVTCVNFCEGHTAELLNEYLQLMSAR
jgi:hypothetical protein